MTQDVQAIISYFTNTLGLYLFPVHTITSERTCSCLKGKDCSSPGKHPFLNIGWKKLATNDFQKLQKTTKNKFVNYAVATGRKSETSGKHLVVVDVDKKEHEILDRLPKTFCYKTGSGGYHFWYWSSVPIKNSVSKIALKVDVRGTGGYVIVPPSKHKSGEKYELLCELSQPLADFPVEMFDLLQKEEAETKTLRKNKKKTKTQLDKIATNWWNKTPVPEIRKSLAGGILIPNGVRNMTIHRLLSSDRAKGVATYEVLMGLANQYRQQLENPETFDDRELRNIVVSVMRYPVYNNSAENVNKNFGKWLVKKGIAFESDSLEKLDGQFFSGLLQSKKCASLEQINQARSEWFQKRNIKYFAHYKPQLLASKLKSLGFSRIRTAKANLWNVDIENLLAQDFKVCDSIQDRRLEMSDEVVKSEETEAAETTEETTEASGPIGPDGNPLTLVEEREEIIETDRKYNPDDYKYTGQERSQELMSAQLKLFEKLTPEQEIEMENGTLLFDEERTRDFMDALCPEDIVGIRNTMYRIKKVENDEVVAVPRQWNKYDRKYHFEGEEQSINIYDLDNALSLGFGQILYRNDKPFGLDKEMAYKIKVRVYADSVGRTYVFRTGREVTPHSKQDTKENGGQ